MGQSSAVTTRGNPQQPRQYLFDSHVTKSESDDSMHNDWVRLASMPAETTTQMTYTIASPVPESAVLTELMHTLQKKDSAKRQNEQSTHYVPGSPQDSHIEEKVSLRNLSKMI